MMIATCATTMQLEIGMSATDDSATNDMDGQMSDTVRRCVDGDESPTTDILLIAIEPKLTRGFDVMILAGELRKNVHVNISTHVRAPF